MGTKAGKKYSWLLLYKKYKEIPLLEISLSLILLNFNFNLYKIRSIYLSKNVKISIFLSVTH